MENGQAKTNGHAGPAKPAPVEEAAKPKVAASPPPGPFMFVDELPTKIRSLMQGAVEAAQADSKKTADRRYLDGLRRGGFLISLALASFDGAVKEKVAAALGQLEQELDIEEKKLREARG